MTTDNLQWLYFGCYKESGHYLWLPGMQKDHRQQYRWLCQFDGILAPQPEHTLYVASYSWLGGWKLAALSWWDRSVDTRPNTNSIVFCDFDFGGGDLMLAQARIEFPEIFARQPDIKIA